MIETRNKDEFSRVYEKFFETIYKVTFLLMKNQQDTADIVQDVFYKFYVNLKEFNDDEHIKAWLLTCSRNACMDFFRSKHRKTTDIDEAIDIGVEFEVDETLGILLELPEKYKTPLYMYYYEGYDTKDISKILGISHPTVRIQLKRGRELLKKKIEGGT